MKIAIVGGGSLRVLGIMRSAMAVPGALDGGEINLYDLNTVRSEAMGRMLLKTPEQRQCGCRVTWGTTLEAALDGADAVGVILFAGTPRSHRLGDSACLRHGFISSDNVSPNGAMLGLRGGPILLNLARQMEQRCPRAWLLDFANPIGVLSGMVNNHTKIRALGLCQGYTNHLWDISRLFGRDEQATGLDVHCAGINHLSFITSGTWQGRDLFEALDERLSGDWQVPELQPWWPEGAKANIRSSVVNLVRFWRDLGVLIFSTEGDGMAHLKYDEAVADSQARHREESAAELEARLDQQRQGRIEADRKFQAWLDRDLDAAFWADHWQQDMNFKRTDEDIFVKIFTALAGIREVKIASSLPNRGAIAGIRDNYAVEYTHYLFKGELRPAGSYAVPDVVQGIVGGLAAHQTMLGDAMAADDPRLLARALLAYPMQPYSKAQRAMYRELLAINADQISPALRAAVEFL